MDIRVKTTKVSKRDREFVKEQGLAYILDMSRTNVELIQEARDRNYGWLTALHKRLLKRNGNKAYKWAIETHTGLYLLQGDKHGAILTLGKRKHFGGDIKIVRRKQVK